jgi:hypothetical protein
VDFGPSAGEESPLVLYGPLDDLYRYQAVSCAISVAHSQITCFSAPGVGKGHYISVRPRPQLIEWP